MKKILLGGVMISILASIGLGFYFFPDIKKKKEAKKIEKINEVTSVFVNKILEEFNQNPSIKPSNAAQKVVDELNPVTHNPYNKNQATYTFETECKSCNSIQYDDSLNMIIITTYDKKGGLDARTVIKPPSFVTYTKEEGKEQQK